MLWAVSQPSSAPWIVLQSQSGLRLWDIEENRPLTGILPGVTEVCASPSGRRLVLLEGESTNPYPVGPVPARSAGFWELSETQ